MGMEWTEEQKQVIRLRNRNLLVAAAAGSGKTAVLVERIITMISDEENPVDIDRLLVVTFTKAAASEMRERISKAIEKKVEEHPGSAHLQRQLTLLHHADITTIDSYCLHLIRNYANELDMDPEFRVGEEGEMKLMRADVIRQLLEDCYAEGKEEFLRFVECYAVGNADGGLEDYIEQLYQFSSGYPWPDLWLERCWENLEADSEEDIEKSGWMRFLMEDLGIQCAELKEQLLYALLQCRSENGPYMYEDMIRDDLRMVQELIGAKGFHEAGGLLSGQKFMRMSSKKDAAVNADKKALVSNIRNQVKKALQDMKKRLCVQDMEEMLAGIRGMREPLNVLIGLTAEFTRRFQERKKEKNTLDFNDLEHLALNILVRRTDEGELEITDAAKEQSQTYDEIMIDEYQDSNLLQETILNSISRERLGQPNIFMVGDVKQSIYKFRLARPELFMEKYEKYGTEDGLYQRIDLHRNFRSRSSVLSDINFFFYQIMTRPLGNIAYDDAAALYPGADYPECGETNDTSTEILLIQPDKEVLAAQQDADYHIRELEAKAAAARIRELVDPQSGFMVYDRNKGCYRRARYGDIVIILRSFKGWAETFLNILLNDGIPAFAQSASGYFSALEVQVVLELLRVIDNPMQDIPMAAVLKSPVGGLSSEDLAVIMGEFRRKFKRSVRGMYRAVLWYAEEGSMEAVRNKLNRFLIMLEEYRQILPCIPLHELVRRVMEETGYYDYVSAMPAGSARQANLDMLLQKALDFENTSYHGLFQFIRYIDSLQKYEIDYGEAAALGENEDTVRITTIHKSKGLEFPIVFVCGIGKRFNLTDSTARILLHPDLGMAADYIDIEQRVKYATLMRKAFQRRIALENIGEELRVLYVALTRAKEKLILTGTDRYLDNKLTKWEDSFYAGDRELPFTLLSQAGSYLDWILMALAREKKPEIRLTIIDLEDILSLETVKRVAKDVAKEDLTDWDPCRVYAGEIREELDKRLKFIYPFLGEAALHAKISVSEMKKSMQMPEADEEGEVRLYEQLPEEGAGATLPDLPEAEEPALPKFMKEEKPLVGALRGVAYHRVLELMDFKAPECTGNPQAAVDSMYAAGRITKEMHDCIRPKHFEWLFRTEIGKRMCEAAAKNALYKEKQFVMGIPARELLPDQDSDELVLVQGIIDCYFEEEDGLVLVDYKTDSITKGQEEILLSRYHVQLVLYKKALEQIAGKRVKEGGIYSFALGKWIEDSGL